MSAIVLADEKQKLWGALQAYAAALSNLTDEQVPTAFGTADELQKLSEDVRSRLRDRLLLYLQVNGQKTTEKGSVAADVGGFTVTAIPTRTGIDPKKLETLLRRKGIDVEAGMDATVAYKVNPEKVAKLLESGRLHEQDREACLYDKAFRVKCAPAGDDNGER